jgi:hypothetical protein
MLFKLEITTVLYSFFLLTLLWKIVAIASKTIISNFVVISNA